MKDYIIQTTVIYLNEYNFGELLKHITHKKVSTQPIHKSACHNNGTRHVYKTISSTVFDNCRHSKDYDVIWQMNKKRISTYLSKMMLENNKRIYFAILRVPTVFPDFSQWTKWIQLHFDVKDAQQVHVKFKVLCSYLRRYKHCENSLMCYTDGYPFQLKLCQNNFTIKVCYKCCWIPNWNAPQE